MKIKELILKIEKSDYLRGRYGKCISEYLKELKQRDPDDLVMWNDGECDRDGIFIPYDEEGNEMGPPQPYKKDQPFPDDGYKYVRVGG